MRHISSFNIAKQPRPLVADAGPDIPGGEGANKGFWRFQWRDRLKRFAKMGRSVKFKLIIDGVVQSFIGRFKGASKQNPNLARVLVKNDPRIPDGYYFVDSDNGEMVLATLSDARLKKAGIGRDEIGRFIPLDEAKGAQRLEDIGYEPLDADSEKPRELKKKMTGAEVQSRKMATVYENLKEEGRFPVPRQTTTDHWGKNSDIAEGAKEDYNLVYEQLKSLDPKWEKQYPTFDDFWKRVESLSVGQTSQSPNDLAEIPEEMKEINRAYAERVLGLAPDGKITFYRNAVNQKGTPEESAIGYVTTNADFAYDYNSQRPNINGNGRYEIDVQPDEVFGMLGYSQLEDEFGVVIGRGVTSQPGRVRRVGDLEQPKLAPWLEKYQAGVGRSTGGTPYRHYALAGQFDLLPVDPLGDTVEEFFQKHNKTAADIKLKFDELYGDGAYDAYKESGNTLTFNKIKDLFVDAGDGKVGLDITRIGGGSDGFLAPSSYGDSANPESFENDLTDNTLKMLSVFQELTGQPFMVHRNNPKAEKLVEEQGGYDGMASALADPFRRDPIPTKTYAPLSSDGDEGGGFGRSLFDMDEVMTSEYVRAVLDDPDKKRRFKRLLDEMERPSFDDVDLPDDWSALDAREAFARRYGATIDELREFLALDAEDPEADSPVYNNAKKFLFDVYRPYTEALKSDALSVKSLRADYYMHPDGTTIVREYAHNRPDPSEPFDDGFAVGGRESVTMAAERYDILRQRAPLNEPLTIKLSDSKYDKSFDSILNEEHGEGTYKSATAYALGTNQIVINMNDTLLHSKDADQQAIEFLKDLLKEGKEVQFPFSYEDLEAMENPSYFGYVLTHEYGHLFDHNHLHIRREYDARTNEGETSKKYNEIFDAHEHDPSEYGATNVSEFFAEHFAYYLMTGKAKHPDIQRDIEERTGIPVLPQDKKPIEVDAPETPDSSDVPKINGLYDNEPADFSFSVTGTTFDSDHTFTDEQYEVLEWFTDGGYDDVSQYLRDGKNVSDRDKAGIEILLDLIDQSTVTSGGMVYRGRPVFDQNQWDEILNFKVGDTFVDRGVGSHSRDGDRAQFYFDMDFTSKPIGKAFYRLSLKNGNKAFVIPDDASSYGSSEKEVILPPGTKYKINGIYDIEGDRVIDVEVLEQEPLKPIDEYASALPDLVPKPFPMKKPEPPKPVAAPEPTTPDVSKFTPKFDVFNYDEPDFVDGKIIVPDSEAARALSKLGKDPSPEDIKKLQEKTKAIFSTAPEKYVPFEPDKGMTPEQFEMLESLTPEGEAAFTYVDSSLTINKGLRDQDPMVEYGKQVEDIDKAMLLSEYLEPGMTVYRLVKLSRWEKFINEKGLAPGKVLIDRAFLSTSHTTAFTDEGREIDVDTGDVNQIPMRIIMPNNTSGLDLSSISWYDKEDEYLLPRNTALRFLGWDSNGYAVFERLN